METQKLNYLFYLKTGVGRYPKEIENLEDLGVDGRLILKYIKVPDETMD